MAAGFSGVNFTFVTVATAARDFREGNVWGSGLQAVETDKFSKNSQLSRP